MKYIIKLIVVACALLLAAYFVDGIMVNAFWPTAILAAFIFGFLSTIVKPLLKLFTLPINILTLGLVGLLINVLVFWLITFVPGVSITGFMPAVIGLVIVSVISWIADAIID